MTELSIEEKQRQAQDWFRTLRDQICADFEALEDALESGAHADIEAGRFTRELWDREESPEAFDRDQKVEPLGESLANESKRNSSAAENGSTDPFAKGGGEISIMKGRVFEKVGVNISVVSGKFSERFQKEMPGGMETPYYWAAGISLVAHLRSPLVPAVHMNTRMICLGDQEWGEEQAKTKLWFGGGGDLNPMIEVEQDTADFHAAFKGACDAFDPAYYDAFSKWCDEYFYIPHRGEARGVGGIFYDYLGFDGGQSSVVSHQSSAPRNDNAKKFGGSNTHRGPHTQAGMQLTMPDEKDWQTRFDFTKAVGEAFRDIYPQLVRRHLHEPWSEEQRAWQLEKRGRYAEYNLLLDRGTRFGLMTGGNPKAILMSLPPMASWS